jgi:hypothetical protein
LMNSVSSVSQLPRQFTYSVCDRASEPSLSVAALMPIRVGIRDRRANCKKVSELRQRLN